MLTGFLWCGRCGGQVKLVPRITDERGRRRYGCPPSKDGGCGGTTIDCEIVHDRVTSLVLARLERDANLTPESPPDRSGELLDRIALAEQRLKDLAAAFADDQDSNPLELRAAGSRIRKQIQELRAELAKETVTATTVDALSVRDAWPDYDLQQRRHVVAKLIDRIEVDRGTGGKFDPRRLRISWR